MPAAFEFRVPEKLPMPSLALRPLVAEGDVFNSKADKVTTITGGGLATGGGDLSANRIITVTKATPAEALAMINDTHAVTPLALASPINSLSTALDARLDSVEAEIIAAREGSASLDAKLDLIESAFLPGVGNTDAVDARGHSFAIEDSDGRPVLAFNAAGRLVNSTQFVTDVANAAGVNSTAQAIANMQLHGLTFNYTDWWGASIAGQSNAIATPSIPALTTAQPYNNKLLSGAVLVPLVETSKETVASGMTAHAKNELVRRLPPWATFVQDWTLTKNMGVAGALLSAIQKGTATYNSGIAAVTSVKNLATTASKTYAERVLVWMHGESDSSGGMSAATYATGIIQFKNDWNTDVLPITGQAARIPMFICQMAVSVGYPQQDGPVVGMLQAAEADSEIIIVVPDYIMPFVDAQHLTNHGQRQLGEYIGKALHRYYVDRRNPSTVRPTGWARVDARTIDVTFYVPVPPLAFDTDLVWPGDLGLGFSVYDAADAEIAMANVKLVSPNRVRITTAADVVAGNKVGYAIKLYSPATTTWAGTPLGARGNLRDSDRSVAYYTNEAGNPYPLFNWCVAFKKTLT